MIEKPHPVKNREIGWPYFSHVAHLQFKALHVGLATGICSRHLLGSGEILFFQHDVVRQTFFADELEHDLPGDFVGQHGLHLNRDQIFD